MTPQQRNALRNLVRYVLDTEERHHDEVLMADGAELDEDDPHGLKARPDFPHVFRDALVLKEFAF